eukprot:UN05186
MMKSFEVKRVQISVCKLPMLDYTCGDHLRVLSEGGSSRIGTYRVSSFFNGRFSLVRVRIVQELVRLITLSNPHKCWTEEISRTSFRWFVVRIIVFIFWCFTSNFA